MNRAIREIRPKFPLPSFRATGVRTTQPMLVNCLKSAMLISLAKSALLEQLSLLWRQHYSVQENVFADLV